MDTTTNDCVGLTCTPIAPFENFTASFNVVNRCEDPVQVNLTIASGSEIVFSALFDQNKVIQFGGDTSVKVEMSRNATHLDFQVNMIVDGGDIFSRLQQCIHVAKVLVFVNDDFV